MLLCGKLYINIFEVLSNKLSIITRIISDLMIAYTCELRLSSNSDTISKYRFVLWWSTAALIKTERNWVNGNCHLKNALSVLSYFSFIYLFLLEFNGRNKGVDSCSCCRPAVQAFVNITLNCLDGHRFHRSVLSPVKCECQPCAGSNKTLVEDLVSLSQKKEEFTIVWCRGSRAGDLKICYHVLV
jgi:hypothetical protein